jgi:hypothetical protein
MAVNLSPVFGVAGQLFDNNGNPLAGGKIFTYLAGSTTPATTYTSSAGNIAHSNPIILDGAGRVPSGEIWLTDGITYKFVVQDSANNLIGTYDNLTGINSNFIAYSAQQEIQTATAGQTVFNLTTMQYLPGTNNLSVFVDGVNQYGPGAQYAFVETDQDTVTFVSGLHVGALVKFTTATPVASNVANAENVIYNPPFVGGVAVTVENKLAQFISVKDFGAVGDGVANDTVAFTSAWAAADPQAVFVPAGTYLVTGSLTGNFFSVGGVTITGGSVIISTDIDANGNFEAKVTPAGEGTHISLSDALMSSSGMQRGRVNYYSATEVEVILPDEVIMGGFRFMGNYKKKRAPMYSSGVSYRAVVSNVTNLGAETTAETSNWYAVFACADDGDTNVTYKLMPFIRVGSVAGSVCTLNYGGENSHTISPATYTWGVNSLVGVDCLVINEGTGNRFSGRVTTISANTTTTVTLNTIGSVGAYDYLLPAPPGFDHYCYLGSFYNDSAGAPYNIADNGVMAMSYMGTNQDPNWNPTGAVAGPPGSKVMWGGYVSPLAGGIIMRSTLSTSTSAGGDIYTNFSHDSSDHVIGIHSYFKDAVAGSSTQIVLLNINFSIGQFMYYWVDGPLVAQRILGQIRAQGWIEP